MLMFMLLIILLRLLRRLKFLVGGGGRKGVLGEGVVVYVVFGEILVLRI